MSDVGTMLQQILVDTREVAGESDEIRLNIIDSCTHHQRWRFWFNELDFVLITKASTDLYGLEDGVPDDTMYVQGSMWLDVDGDEDNRHEVVRRSPAYLEFLRSHQAYSNWPEYYAIKGKKILIYPASDDEHTLRWRGNKKIPAPRKHYDTATAAWIFPDGDTFTNEFFVEAERSVREYANYLRLSGTTADEARGRSALTKHLEAKAALDEETAGRHMASRADPWPYAM